MGAVVETFYGKYSKYEVFRGKSDIFGDGGFWIYRDGELYKGAYSSLRDAVDAARRMSES